MTIGATRRIDQLGRVVVPVELRRTLAIREGDLLEVTAEDGRLILRKVAPECALCGRHDDLMDLREKWRKELRSSANALSLLDDLFLNPYVTVAYAQSVLKVSNPTARQVVVRMQEAGLLKEVTGRAWGRLYVAEPVLHVIEGAAKSRRKASK